MTGPLVQAALESLVAARAEPDVTAWDVRSSAQASSAISEIARFEARDRYVAGNGPMARLRKRRWHEASIKVRELGERTWCVDRKAAVADGWLVGRFTEDFGDHAAWNTYHLGVDGKLRVVRRRVTDSGEVVWENLRVADGQGFDEYWHLRALFAEGLADLVRRGQSDPDLGK